MAHYDDVREDALNKLWAEAQEEMRYNRISDYKHTPRRGTYKLIWDDLNLPYEMFAFIDALRFGASKYPDQGFLDKESTKCSHKDMHASMFRHLSQSFCKIREDDESGLDHLLHLAARALMMYTRIQRGLDD